MNRPPSKAWLLTDEYKTVRWYIERCEAGHFDVSMSEVLQKRMNDAGVGAFRTLQFWHCDHTPTQLDLLPIDTPRRRQFVRDYVRNSEMVRRYGVLTLGFAQQFKNELCSYLFSDVRGPLLFLSLIHI